MRQHDAETADPELAQIRQEMHQMRTQLALQTAANRNMGAQLDKAKQANLMLQQKAYGVVEYAEPREQYVKREQSYDPGSKQTKYGEMIDESDEYAEEEGDEHGHDAEVAQVLASLGADRSVETSEPATQAGGAPHAVKSEEEESTYGMPALEEEDTMSEVEVLRLKLANAEKAREREMRAAHESDAAARRLAHALECERAERARALVVAKDKKDDVSEWMFKPLNATESKQIANTMKEELLESVWQPKVEAFMSNRFPLVYDIMTAAPEQWEAIVTSDTYTSTVDRANRWLADSLMKSLAPSEESTAFENIILNTCPEYLTDGWSLYQSIFEPLMAVTGEELEAKLTRFDENIYFTAGATKIKTVSDIENLKRGFARLPERTTEQQDALPLAVARHLAKVNPEAAAEIKRKIYKDQSMYRPFRWTWEVLASQVAIAVASAPRDTNAFEKGRHHKIRPGAPSAERPRETQCKNCGVKEGEAGFHQSRECTFKPSCGTLGCACGHPNSTRTGVKGKAACVVCGSRRPIGQEKDFVGNRMNRYIQKFMTKAWDEKHPDEAAKLKKKGEAHDTEAEAVTPKLIQSPGDEGFESENIEEVMTVEKPTLLSFSSEYDEYIQLSKESKMVIDGKDATPRAPPALRDSFHCGGESRVSRGEALEDSWGRITTSVDVSLLDERPTSALLPGVEVGTWVRSEGERAGEQGEDPLTLAPLSQFLQRLLPSSNNNEGLVQPELMHNGVGRSFMIGAVFEAYAFELEAKEVELNNVNLEGDEQEWLLDGGSNTNLIKAKKIFANSDVASINTSIVGVWNNGGASTSINKQVTFAVELDGNAPPMIVSGPYNEDARRNILSESWLFDTYGARAFKEPVMKILFGDNDTFIDIYRRNGLYFVKGTVFSKEGYTQIAKSKEAYSFEANMVNAPYGDKISGQQRALLWAARLGGGERTVLEAVTSTIGTGLGKLTTNMKKAIAEDVLRKRAWMRHKPVKSIGQGATLEPGELLVIDFSGPEAAPGVCDGAHYLALAVCAATTYAYDGAMTGISPAVVIQFIMACISAEKLIGNTVKRIRIDADPKLVKAIGVQELESKLNAILVVLQAGPGHRHESVAHAEQRIDTTTRVALEMLARAQRGRAFKILYKQYANQVLNYRCRRGDEKSRYERHNRAGPPDFTTMASPVLPGTLVAYAAEPGFKGLLDDKAPIGEIIGLRKIGYIVLSHASRKAIFRHKDQVSLLNELTLLGRGRPDVFSRATYPEVDKAPLMDMTREPPSKDVFPKVTQFEKSCDPTMVGPPSTRLARERNQPVRYTAMHEVVDNIKETSATELEAVDMINALIFRANPDKAGELYIDRISQASEAIRDCHQEVGARANMTMDLVHLLECEAVEKRVLIMTDLGEKEMIVPATMKGVMKSLQKEEWLASMDKAIRVQLAVPDNTTIRKSDMPAGEPLIQPVFPRDIKKDKVTGKMNEVRGLYTRMGVDGAEMARKYAKRGRPIERPEHAPNLDPIVVNLAYEHAARYRCNITSADVPNAYAQGERLRPLIYVDIPKESSYAFDEDGEPMCIAMGAPGQGEIPAGDEWHISAHGGVKSIGWEPAETVSNVYTFLAPNMKMPDVLLKNVDEFLLITMPGSPMRQPTLDKLSELWGSNNELGPLKIKNEPNEFLSKEHFRDVEGGRLTWYRTAAIEKAVMKHLPDIEKERPSSKLSKGQTVRLILDSLKLIPMKERASKLTATQKRAQKKIGDLKFPEDAAPEVSLKVHKLSAVMVYPPPQAEFAADLVLEDLWDARFGGVTYGGDGVEHNHRVDGQFHATLDLEAGQAPDEPEFGGDATWQLEHDRYGTFFTKGGGLIKATTKFIRTITDDPMDSSMIAESVPTSKSSEDAEYLAEIVRAFGAPVDGPMVVITDSTSNGMVARRKASGQRIKHAMRRWTGIHKRVAKRLITVVHVGDASMPADFLTKWVPKKKVEDSVEYLTNRYNKVHHPRDPENPCFGK